ncbi:hypothetical protein ACA910_021956 [Epithemia clementina (nom. ined.)]
MSDVELLDGDGDTIHQLVVVVYKWNAAVGMLQLQQGKNNDAADTAETQLPRWIPLVHDQETVLISNGWSFLDLDDSEPLSSFDIDAANREGTYIPKWQQQQQEQSPDLAPGCHRLSSLGFSLDRIPTTEQVESLATERLQTDLARRVLLEGASDPRGQKRTHNGFDLTGSVKTFTWFRNKKEKDESTDSCSSSPGIFTCALTHLPLFASTDLMPTTATSGWLSFARPIADDHVVLLPPESKLTEEEEGRGSFSADTPNGASSASHDTRTEVLCPISLCHLGHYFGPGEGYCINASVLNFLQLLRSSNDENYSQTEKKISNADSDDATACTHINHLSFSNLLNGPVSYRIMLEHQCSDYSSPNPAVHLLQRVVRAYVPTETIVLGAGCFWHVEAALRRLPGVVSTTVGYAGGGRTSSSNNNNNNNNAPPTYQQVCEGHTGHAEVVQVEFDPRILSPRTLFDCFLALHNPTKVRAHGKHAIGIGQYRSCIFLSTNQLESMAWQAISDCQRELASGREVVTEVQVMKDTIPPWFWPAEEHHQRHDERKRDGIIASASSAGGFHDGDAQAMTATLTVTEWLNHYGRRKESVLGSSMTLEHV